MENGRISQKGKQHFQMLAGFVILLAFANTVYEVIYGYSYAILGIQLALMVFTLVLPFGLMNGRKQKNVFFAFLFLVGVFAFYQAGTRMPDMRKTEITMDPIITLCAGMGFIFSGIYLSYSPEIAVYILEEQSKRQKLKQKPI